MKAISPDDIAALVRPLFFSVYEGQMNRIINAINRASPETIDAFIDNQFADEPPLVEDASLPILNDMATQIGQASLEGLDTVATWETINQSLFNVASQRARWFANNMTETSLKQTQEVIAQWRETGGAINELKDLLRPVWTGPRPDVAAVTEATNMTAQARHVAWQSSGVVWGYSVQTANDSLVRPSHTEVAQGGPYPLTDTIHLPPINGDPNCRCYPVPVLENPYA